MDIFNKQDISVLQTTKRKYTSDIITLLSKENIQYDHYTARVKTNESISCKLQNKNIEPTPQNAIGNLSDIIGIRIVVRYISDIYKISDIICHNYRIKEQIDYVTNPKKSGYRSLHIIFNAPIMNNNFIFPYADDIDIEIQIRTMGMDFWSGIEHMLVYEKQKTGNDQNKTTELIGKELRQYAEEIFNIDMHLQALQHLM